MKISPEIYKRMAMQHARLKTMKQGQFVQWACSFWQNAYDEGFFEAEKKYTQDGINVSDDIDAKIFTIEDIREILLSVKGIGEKRTNQVLQKIGE
jgi:hypothetical protein